MTKAVVLFGHGARDPEWARPMEFLREKLLNMGFPGQVKLAFLELMEPSLEDTCEMLVEKGMTEIRIIPIFFGRGGHLKNDFPKLLIAMQEKYPNVDIKSTDAVGQWTELWQFLAHQILKMYKVGDESLP